MAQILRLCLPLQRQGVHGKGKPRLDPPLPTSTKTREATEASGSAKFPLRRRAELRKPSCGPLPNPIGLTLPPSRSLRRAHSLSLGPETAPASSRCRQTPPRRSTSPSSIRCPAAECQRRRPSTLPPAPRFSLVQQPATTPFFRAPRYPSARPPKWSWRGGEGLQTQEEGEPEREEVGGGLLVGERTGTSSCSVSARSIIPPAGARGHRCGSERVGAGSTCAPRPRWPGRGGCSVSAHWGWRLC